MQAVFRGCRRLSLLAESDGAANMALTGWALRLPGEAGLRAEVGRVGLAG